MTAGDPALLADAAAALLDLELSAASRAGVAANLRLLFERAADFAELPLPDEAEPASLLRL